MSATDVLHPAQFGKQLPRPSSMSTVCPKCRATRDDSHHICAGKPVGGK